MQTITLFEHQRRRYEDLDLAPDHPVIERLARLNNEQGAELVLLGRKSLKATQHVGVIHLGEITLQILPKIDYDPAGDADSYEGTPSYVKAANSATRNLLYMLSYAYGLKIREQDAAPLARQPSNWFDLLTRLFARDLHKKSNKEFNERIFTRKIFRETVK